MYISKNIHVDCNGIELNEKTSEHNIGTINYSWRLGHLVLMS